MGRSLCPSIVMLVWACVGVKLTSGQGEMLGHHSTFLDTVLIIT